MKRLATAIAILACSTLARGMQDYGYPTFHGLPYSVREHDGAEKYKGLGWYVVFAGCAAYAQISLDYYAYLQSTNSDWRIPKVYDEMRVLTTARGNFINYGYAVIDHSRWVDDWYTTTYAKLQRELPVKRLSDPMVKRMDVEMDTCYAIEHYYLAEKQKGGKLP